jgi:glycerol uptake facilitator-like aquaporin
MLEFLQQYLTTVAGALTIMSLAFLIFWIAFGKSLSNRKVQLSKRAGWSQIKEEIGASLLSFIGSTVFMFIILSFKDNGLTKFYVMRANTAFGMKCLPLSQCCSYPTLGFIGATEPCTTQVYTSMSTLYTIKV